MEYYWIPPGKLARPVLFKMVCNGTKEGDCSKIRCIYCIFNSRHLEVLQNLLKHGLIK